MKRPKSRVSANVVEGAVTAVYNTKMRLLLTVIVIFLYGFGGIDCVIDSWGKPQEGETKSFPDTSQCSNLVTFQAFTTPSVQVSYRYLFVYLFMVDNPPDFWEALTPKNSSASSLQSVTPGSLSSPFAIDQNTGILTCTASEVTESRYDVTVRASEPSPSTEVSDRSIVITFPEPPVQITLPSPPTLSVAKDLFEQGGDFTAQIDYQFNVSDPSATVNLVSKPLIMEVVPFNTNDLGGGQYALGLSSTLSTKTSPYEFLILAQESSNPVVTATVTVMLLERPVWLSPYDTGSYSTNINEYIGSSGTILTLSANDPDAYSLTYTVVGTTPPSNTPLFTTNGAVLETISNIGTNLDVDPANAQRTYNLTVEASNGMLSTQTIIIIYVDDVNDLTPVFSPGQTFDITIPETTQAGQEVIKVTVTDGDFSSPNNEITLDLLGDDNAHFAIDDTGSLTVASPSQLDYTSRSKYELVIIATDKATSNALSTSQNLNITLETQPAFLPPFNTGSYTTNTGEDNTGVVLTMLASDEEMDTLTYTITNISPSNTPPLFVMSGADITVNTGADLDVDSAGTIQRYTLTVEVSDGKYSASTTIIIDIDDVNDLRPVFSAGQNFDILLLETTTAGQEVIKVTVTDGNLSAPNNEITLSLSGNDNDHFTIDDTGSITVASPSQLDYTSRSKYELVITATDKATSNALSTTQNLNITLETQPAFLPPYNTGSYTTNTGEDNTGAVLTMSASDEDMDTLTYTITNISPSNTPPLFVMSGADITVNTGADLDVDPAGTIQRYTLTVEVSDGKYSASTTVIINIDDVNDLRPVFSAGQNFDILLLETTTAEQEVLKVTVTDGDLSADNNEITLSLSGDDNVHFAIDDTGSITVASPSQLDYTSRSKYELVITATDNATSNALSATQNLNITLEASPRFITPNDSSTVLTEMENIGPGKPLFYCEVADEDTDLGLLQLSVDSVQPASGVSLFEMDGVTLKTTASVTTNTFDLEGANAVDSFLITIRVSDGKYNADTNIRVNITDVNDNNPTFSGALTATIADTLSIGDAVTIIAASDADVSTQYNTITYSIEGNTQDHTYFTINENTGVLSLAKQPLKTPYVFTVKASDVDNKEATTTLTVTVNDTVDECLSTPCLNSGSCFNNINYFFCDCVAGWTGRLCETNINDCDPNPCENNGDCTDGVATFTCNCTAGWSGNTCTQACTNNQYGRNCLQTCMCNDTRLASDVGDQKCNITSGDCFCNTRWTGSDCEMDVNECIVNTSICSGAPNQACENSEGSYQCVCAVGYTLNATNDCVADQSTTTPVNAGEFLVEATVTQNIRNCPDVTAPSTTSDLGAAEFTQRFPDVNSCSAKDLSCGSLIYVLTILINDTVAAKTALALAFNDVGNGKPLVFNGETTVASALIVSGKQVTINSTEDPTVQLCNVYTSYSPCPADFECKINAGTPFCQEKEKDRSDLILGLAIGVPLGVLAIVAVLVVLCHFGRKRQSDVDINNRHEERLPEPRHRKSKKSKGGDSRVSSKSKHHEYYYPRNSDLPYAPSIEYDIYSAVDPAWSRQNLSRSQKDWMFYKPAARNNGSNYRQSQRY